MVEEAQQKTFTVVSLYPKDMNIYGDRGNVLALLRRATQHGFSPHLIEVNIGDELPTEADIIIGGGGQDSGQVRVAQDLQRLSPQLHRMAEAGVPMLMICGLYQLFGHNFITSSGKELSGIGVLDVTTRGGDTRMIGNVLAVSDAFGEIIGYENHSGDTILGSGSQPLARVILGDGNNPRDAQEGARSHNVIGSYLHGSLLPKNPAITDWLIEVAAQRKFGSLEPVQIDDALVHKAREQAKKRPR